MEKKKNYHQYCSITIHQKYKRQPRDDNHFSVFSHSAAAANGNDDSLELTVHRSSNLTRIPDSHNNGHGILGDFAYKPKQTNWRGCWRCRRQLPREQKNDPHHQFTDSTLLALYNRG